MASGDFGKQIRDGIISAAKRELQQRFSAVRHPETGEFPTVIVEGDRLEDLRVRIEGTPALIEIVRARMGDDALKGVEMATTQLATPKVFLSYAFDDSSLASLIAHALQAAGIETWWAEWEMGPGDSIRRKIDAGLGNCTHFIVLLTPNSIDRPWVQEEIDAGFVMAVDKQCKFIPLRNHLAISALPPLLRPRLSPEIDDAATNLSSLISFIHGVSVKPPLGPAPTATSAPNTGYSPAASSVAKYIVTKSVNGQFADPQTTIAELAKEAGLTEEDVKDALHEIRHYVDVSRERVLPKDEFFPEFDKHFMPWDPAEDALHLASDIVNDEAFTALPSEIASLYGWPARRLNSAITFLAARELAQVHEGMGSGPYVTHRILGTDATRRFVKSRS